MRPPPNFAQPEDTHDPGIRASSKPPKRFRYAIEKLPSKALAGSSLEVDHQRYNAARIRSLYASELYPLSRNRRAL
jgi:hypothetical protein